MPLVTKIISEYEDIPLEDVRKAGEESVISFGETKVLSGTQEHEQEVGK